MKERRFDAERINQLAQEYVETSDDSVFERLMLEELEPMIGVQLGKNYISMKGFWEDMRQEVLLYLWKNRESVKTTKSRNCYRFYYQRIRQTLNAMVTNGNRNPTRITLKRGMKISSYDVQRDNVTFLDNLSNANKLELGIGNIEENYGE